MSESMNVEELELIIDNQLRAMADEETKLENKLFNRQLQKTKEISNLAGKKIAIIGQQLYANEIGAQIAIPALGIGEGQITMAPKNKLAKLLS